MVNLASRLTIIPCELDEANYFVSLHHRKLGPVVGHKFSIAVMDDFSKIRGVAIVGHPNARGLADLWTLEVTRNATDGCPNACSALYGAAWRAARAMGYRRLITYTGKNEPGTSLIAAGFKIVAEVTGREWSCPSRPRINRRPLEDKFRWELTG